MPLLLSHYLAVMLVNAMFSCQLDMMFIMIHTADNIMIDKHNDSEFTVKLVDFGTCHTKGARLSSTTANTTYLYWSPEIWQALANKVTFVYMTLSPSV